MLISLLVTIIVLGLLYYIVTLLPLPQPFKQIALVIFILIAVVWLLSYIPGVPWGGHMGAYGCKP